MINHHRHKWRDVTEVLQKVIGKSEIMHNAYKGKRIKVCEGCYEIKEERKSLEVEEVVEK